jgi:hypothetical protein
VLGALVIVKNPVSFWGVLINGLTENVGAFDPEMAVAQAQIAHLLFTDEGVVLLRTRKTRAY